MRGQVTTMETEGAWATEPGALRRLAPLFVAGGLAGMIAGGLGSRIAMRIAALAAPESAQGLQTEAQATIGQITLDGTLFLVLFAGIASATVGTAFYLGVLVVTLQRPARRLVDAVGGGISWREALVNVATVGAAALTAFGLTAVALHGGGRWTRLWMLSLLVCAAGLASIHPDRSRPITRPALRIAGGTALAVIAISGGVALLDAVT